MIKKTIRVGDYVELKNGMVCEVKSKHRQGHYPMLYDVYCEQFNYDNLVTKREMERIVKERK